ncbi:capsule assembly Wzi family protein [Shewanella sp. NIFS-20-20]|uniref:capsule assembly Wzi family protein n=1 Tax=Shewanella sp. NIFS-20-20 TaxID=2853806 RepID=UPI001C47FCD7|nr:capsule assembly Wzi family protein [Shewanella sp. NIFS-20-20]MBV7316129.1 capsule assembly Wzi family protein [Shewanella sp. NIFS-20-20]
MVLAWSGTLTAAPWVDTSDVYLRADIQALADAGVITVPVNTYPLMWAGIGVDLAKAEPSLLTPALATAFARVNFYYRNAIQNRGNSRLKLVAASDPARFQHFGSDYREQGQLTVSHEYTGSRFAYKLSASANYDPIDEKEYRLDDSYLAMVLGNWVFTAGTLDQWWGPGFDTGLMKSTNARPMPSIMLSRNNAHGFETPWLSWIGPWTLTTGLSLFEQERYAPNTLLWNARGTLRPLQQLEIGFSWTMQFCGEGQECDASTFFKALTGQKDCRNDVGFGCTNFGNQMAGFDIRYSDTFWDIPLGLYLEKTCEDSSGPSPLDLADCGYLWGMDSRFGDGEQQYKLFVEYTDTLRACGEDESAFNCFYEHSTYLSGSRYYDRALGSTYDSDAQVYVLGMVVQFANSQGLHAFLRYAQLNKDGLSPSNGWAPVTPKEDLLMLEMSYRMPIWQGMLTFGGTVSNSEFEQTDSSDTNGTVFSSYEYKF